MTVSSENRFKRGRPCPVCGGDESAERGEGMRCFGFISQDGAWCHCTREDHAGPLEVNASSGTYAHKLHGDCRCGVRHGAAEERQRGNGRGTVVVTYDYTDEHGVVLFQAVRYVPKGFKQRRPDGRGGWIDNLKGARRVLYRLPELLASDSSETVYIAEGEKDVDNLRKLGLVSTCNPMGALKWHGVAELAAEVLHGRPVVIIADKDGDGRKHAVQVAKALHDVAASVRVLELPGDGIKDATDWIDADPAHDAAALRAIADAAPEWEPAADVDPEPSTSRPVILIGPDEDRMVDEAMHALVTDPNLYERGPALVRVGPDSPPRIEAVPKAWIEVALARTAAWCRYDPKSQSEVPAYPPRIVVEAVNSAGHWPGVRRLAGVVETPVLRPDGSMLETPGYDAASGLLYRPTWPVNPTPAQPTLDDALDALDEVTEAVADFPFEEDAHRAAWLAAVLTLIGRWSFEGPSPMCLIDANTRGSGKGLLAQVAAIIATGRTIPVSPWPGDVEEQRKQITALALAGDPVVLLDNVVGKLGSSALNAALTSDTWKDRILGVSRNTGTLPLKAVWFATGNNADLDGDTTRRVIHVRLLSPEERPEDRQGFHHFPLLPWVRRERPRLAAAALCILRAHDLAGRPDCGLASLGSYDGWSRIRHAVAWLGLPDPVSTQRALAGRADREVAELRGVLAGLEDIAPGGERLPIREILERAKGEHGVTLYRTLLEYCPGKGGNELPTSLQLSGRLRHFEQRVVGGKAIVSHNSDRTGARLWSVQVAGAPVTP